MSSCAKSESSKCGLKTIEELNSLTEVVEHYEKNNRFYEDEEMKFYRSSKTFKGLIDRAKALLDDESNRHAHQRRIKRAAMKKLAIKLEGLEEKDIKSKNFNELHTFLDNLLGCIPGIGKLTIYDTATRIGIKFGIEPEQVYLHRGARAGARNLLGKKRLGRKVDKSIFGDSFDKLSPSHVENLLCIYKDELKGLQV